MISMSQIPPDFENRTFLGQREFELLKIAKSLMRASYIAIMMAYVCDSYIAITSVIAYVCDNCCYCFKDNKICDTDHITNNG